MSARDPLRWPKALAQPMLGRPGFAGTASFRLARKAAVAVIGSSVLAFGVAFIVLPAPASLFIPLGLAILATEFLWARKLLGQLKARARQVLGKPARPVGPEVQP